MESYHPIPFVPALAAPQSLSPIVDGVLPWQSLYVGAPRFFSGKNTGWKIERGQGGVSRKACRVEY